MWVSVYVELTHPRINDLIISITSPVGWPSTYGYYASYVDQPGLTMTLYNRNCAVGVANMATWFEDNGPNILTSSSCNVNTGFSGTSSRSSSTLMAYNPSGSVILPIPLRDPALCVWLCVQIPTEMASDRKVVPQHY